MTDLRGFSCYILFHTGANKLMGNKRKSNENTKSVSVYYQSSSVF